MSNATIQNEISNPNSTTTNGSNNHTDEADSQLAKYLCWTTKIIDVKCRLEIWNLVLPLYVHLHLDQLQFGHKMFLSPKVVEVISKNHSEEEIALIDSLQKISSTNDIKNVSVLNTFRSCKYRVNILPETNLLLQKFFEKYTPNLLVEVFQKWFQLECLEDKNYADLSKRGIDKLSLLCSDTEKELECLKTVFKESRQTPSDPLPVSVYSLPETENICCASMSPSNVLLASGSLSSEIKLWNVHEVDMLSQKFCGCVHKCQHNQQSILKGHRGPVYDVSFYSQTDVLLSVSRDCEMRAWRMSDNSCVAVYKGHFSSIWCLSIASLGTHIATGSRDRTVRIWNLDRVISVRILVGHKEDVNCVKFHPNGIYIAAGSEDKTIRMWDIATGKMSRIFTGHGGSIKSISFSPDGKFIASGGDKGIVKIWDVGQGKLLANLKGHNSVVSAVSWSKCGSTVASTSVDGTVLLWHTHAVHSDLDQVAGLDSSFRLSTGLKSALSLHYSQKNACVVVGIN